MRIVTVEYDEYHIGFAHMFSPTHDVLAYVKEIYLLYLNSKPLYIFLKEFVIICTTEKIIDEFVWTKIAGTLVNLKFPTTVDCTHNVFSFDIANQISLDIKTQLKKKTSSILKVQLENVLRKYLFVRIMCEVDVIEVTLNI